MYVYKRNLTHFLNFYIDRNAFLHIRSFLQSKSLNILIRIK